MKAKELSKIVDALLSKSVVDEENLVGENDAYVHRTLKNEAEAHSYEPNKKEPRFHSMMHYSDYGYKDMNSRLRHGTRKVTAPANPDIKMSTSKMIDHFKELTKNKTNHSFDAYRGVKYKPEFNNLNKDDIIHDKGFTSVSTNPEIAHSFAVSGARFKVHVPEGTKGYYVSGHPKKFLMSEKEFVLHPGTKFKVGDKGSDKYGEFTHLHIHSQEE